MRKNNRKLDNRGFTLIELLAVIVLLALVMVIGGPMLMDTINGSRRKTLYSVAQTAASNLNTWITDDMIAQTESERKLGENFVKYTQNTKKNEWICLDDSNIKNISNNGQPSSLLNVLGFSETDVVIKPSAKIPAKVDADGDVETPDEYVIIEDEEIGDDGVDKNTCSALRYNSTIGGYEFLLVAKKGGKFYNAGDNAHFAFSKADGPNELISN